jgi:uncharacterized membrane protein required for colicin V production
MDNAVIVDSIVIAYIAYSLIAGLRHGLFNVLISLFGIYGSFFVARSLTPHVGPFLATHGGLPIHDWPPAIVFSGVWVSGYIGIRLAAWGLTRLTDSLGSGWVMRGLGGLVNGGKSIALASVILTVLGHFLPTMISPLTQPLVNWGSRIIAWTDSTSLLSPYGIGEDFRYNLIRGD